MRTFFYFLSVSIVAILLLGSTPAISKSYSIIDYGAKGDGKFINTTAIQSAIDAAALAGGGTVCIPAGTWLTGTITFKSNITLLLDAGAILLGSTNLKDYPSHIPSYRSYTDNYTERSLIYAEKCKNIAILGRGEINGQGGKFPIERHPYKIRPYLLRFIECANLIVRDITIKNSPMWVQHYLSCENVIIDGITVDSHHSNLNNDGIDIDSCDKVRITNSFIYSEDDAIVLKSTSNRPCKNVTVMNCILSSNESNAFKCGTESNGGFQNITVSNCTIYDTRKSGIALEMVDGGLFDRVIISNIVMDNTNNPIFIRLGNRARPYKEGMEKPGMGSMKNIIISNVIATNTGKYNKPDLLGFQRKTASPLIGSSILGLPGYDIENVTLENIRIEWPGGGSLQDANIDPPEDPDNYPEYSNFGITPSYGFFCRHVKNLKIYNLHMTFNQTDHRPALVVDDVKDLHISDLDAQSTDRTTELIRLKNVKDAIISQNNPSKGAQVFVKVEGETSKNIAIMNNKWDSSQIVK